MLTLHLCNNGLYSTCIHTALFFDMHFVIFVFFYFVPYPRALAIRLYVIIHMHFCSKSFNRKHEPLVIFYFFSRPTFLHISHPSAVFIVMTFNRKLFKTNHNICKNYDASTAVKVLGTKQQFRIIYNHHAPTTY